MSRNAVFACLMLTLAGCALHPAAATEDGPQAHLSAARNAAGEVVATVTGTVRACGITSTNDEPTFAVHGDTVEVTQSMAGVACMNPPPKTKPYRRNLNLGKLPPGKYLIRWNYPELTLDFAVPSNQP
jgi:hypothetical protein